MGLTVGIGEMDETAVDSDEQREAAKIVHWVIISADSWGILLMVQQCLVGQGTYT